MAFVVGWQLCSSPNTPSKTPHMTEKEKALQTFLKNIATEPANARARRRLMQREVKKYKKKMKKHE
tara:strand:+ start:668 stop:865 length:198 start_codon:yes stop_codon:yes gene_type:complete